MCLFASFHAADPLPAHVAYHLRRCVERACGHRAPVAAIDEPPLELALVSDKNGTILLSTLLHR